MTSRRRVRCPNCTAILTEPQTQIYECPICSTYLLAKGHGVSKTSAKSLNVDGGDDEEAQKAADGGAKLEKASLSSNDEEPLRGERKNSRYFERENASQPDTHAESDPRSPSLAKHSLPKSGHLPSGLSSDIRLEKSGELSPTHSSLRQSSDLDSDSHSESEVDSPLLSPKDVTVREGPQVSSFVQSSSEVMTSTVTGSRAERQGENRDAQKDAKNGDKQQTSAQQAHHAQEVKDTIEDYCDKQQILTQRENFTEESAGNKEVGGAHSRKNDGSESRTAIKIGSETATRKFPPKETVKGEDLQNKGDCKEKAVIGKFQLFDLSVFGIYNEETYKELRRGKVADYQSVTGKNVNVDINQLPDVNESSKVVFNKESSENASNEIVLHLDTITGVSKLAVPGNDTIYAGTGDNSDTQVKASNENTGPKRLDSSLGGAENAGVGSLDHEKPLSVSDRDIDALAKARYGDDLGVSELATESTSVDISFGDWQSEHLSKPSNNVLKLDPEHEDYGKGAMNSATEDDADSSCDGTEELTFSNTGERGLISEETVVRNGSDGSLATNAIEKPAFPVRTTDMELFLKRDDQQSASKAPPFETVVKSDCEAPYVEHYSSCPVNDTQEDLDQAPQPTLLHEDNAPLMREESRVEGSKLEHAQNETEFQRQSILHPHGSFSSISMKRLDVLPASERREEDRRQAPSTNKRGTRKGFEPVVSLEEDGILRKTASTSLKAADFAPQKARHFNQPNPNRPRNLAGAPVSLKREGRRSDVFSASSAEDEGVYGMESEAGDSPEKYPYREGSRVSNGSPYPEREGIHGAHEESKDSPGRVSQHSSVSAIKEEWQKFGSEQPLILSRTGRSRPSSKILSKQGLLMGDDRFHVEEKILGSEASEWTGLGNQRDQPNFYLGTGLNMPRAGLDQISHHGSPGITATDYGNDYLTRSQEIPSHSGHIEYLPKSRGSSLSAGARAYSSQLPPYGPAALTGSHEEVHAHPIHAHHHGISPTCPVCIQQHYYLHHSQIHQSMMLHQCAACAAQALVARQPMHPKIHGSGHMQSLTHPNHSQRHSDSIPDSFALPAESSRQNRSHVQHDHLNMPARRMKRYPPLPGKGSPPYVLCRHCHQLLQVPEYLPTVSGPVQKLHCDACGKTSKFSIPQPESPASLPSMKLSDRDNFVEIDKDHMDISHAYSSGQRSSSGVVSSPQNLLGEARPVPGQGMKQAWIEKPETLRSNAHGISPTQPDIAGHQSRFKPLAATMGSGQAAYGSRHINGKHASNDAGPYGEDCFSSSTSSASGSSPERLSQLSQGQQLARTFVTGRTSRDPKYSTTSRTSVHNQGRSSPEALSFSEGSNQTGAIENRIRVFHPGLQVSVPESFGNSLPYAQLKRHDNDPSSGIWHSELPDGNYSHFDSPRSHLEQAQKVGVASGSPRVEHFSRGMVNDLPSARHRQLHSISGNGLRSAQRSPNFETRASPHDSYSHRDNQRRSFEDDHHSQLPLHDSAKGPMLFAGLLKRSIKDRGKRGQQGGNYRKVIVNGFLISEAAVLKAEERAGPIHSGTYWYDYQAGFWGVLGGPCLGILMPFIEEFHFPLARDCAGGKTGILVNGRELHDEDLEVLAKRGLPTTPGKAYVLDIRGALFDDWSGQPLKGLGKLAPSIEKRGRGFGMSPSMPMG